MEIFPAYSSDTVIRVEFFGDEIDRISEVNPLTGELKGVVGHAAIYPASHYIVPPDKLETAILEINREDVYKRQLDDITDILKNS